MRIAFKNPRVDEENQTISAELMEGDIVIIDGVECVLWSWDVKQGSDTPRKTYSTVNLTFIGEIKHG